MKKTILLAIALIGSSFCGAAKASDDLNEEKEYYIPKFPNEVLKSIRRVVLNVDDRIIENCASVILNAIFTIPHKEGVMVIPLDESNHQLIDGSIVTSHHNEAMQTLKDAYGLSNSFSFTPKISLNEVVELEVDSITINLQYDESAATWLRTRFSEIKNHFNNDLSQNHLNNLVEKVAKDLENATRILFRQTADRTVMVFMDKDGEMILYSIINRKGISL